MNFGRLMYGFKAKAIEFEGEGRSKGGASVKCYWGFKVVVVWALFFGNNEVFAMGTPPQGASTEVMQLLSVRAETSRQRAALFDLVAANPEMEVWSDDPREISLSVRTSVVGRANCLF